MTKKNDSVKLVDQTSSAQGYGDVGWKEVVPAADVVCLLTQKQQRWRN